MNTHQVLLHTQSFLNQLVHVSKKVPQLPKLSIKGTLPFLPLFFSPQTVLLVHASYKVYTQTQFVCDTLCRPFQYYVMAEQMYQKGRQVRRWVTGRMGPQELTHTLTDQHFQKMCDDEAGEWIFLFPEDEHLFSKENTGGS